ncbi:Homeobox domain [Trinorchestia longiramus]|nr:Homeobox domain [Trinorchestia longiramus]
MANGMADWKANGMADWKANGMADWKANGMADWKANGKANVSACSFTGVYLKVSLGVTSSLTGRTRTRDKYRVVYSEHQRLELEKEYNFNRYITIKRKTELADSLALSERQIKIWFQNRRAKDRKNTNKKKSSCKETSGSQMLNSTSSVNPATQHSILGSRIAQANPSQPNLNASQDGAGGYIIPETTRMLPSQEFQSQMALADGQQGVQDHTPPDTLQLMHLHHQQDHHQHHHQRQQQQHQQFGTQQHSPNLYHLTPAEYAASYSSVSPHNPFLPTGGPFHHDVSSDIRFQHQMANIPYFDAFHNSNPYHHQHQAPHMQQQHQQLHLHQQLQHPQHQHQQSNVSSAIEQPTSEPGVDSATIPATVNLVEKTKRESSPNVKSEYSP